MMKFFRRFRADGTQFFIDEHGNEVTESVARRNLVETAGRSNLAENRQPPPERQPLYSREHDDFAVCAQLLATSAEEAEALAEGLRKAAAGIPAHD